MPSDYTTCVKVMIDDLYNIPVTRGCCKNQAAALLKKFIEQGMIDDINETDSVEVEG